MDPLSDVLARMRPQSYLTADLDVGGDWAIGFDNQVGTIRRCASLRATASCCRAAPVRAYDIPRQARLGSVVVHRGGGDVMFVGTRFDTNGRKAEALPGTLPPVVHLEAVEDQAALRWPIERIMDEMREGRPGASLATHHLAHLMLPQALRLHLSGRAGNEVGWFYALADPHLNNAIEVMHADPAHRWTPGELAARAGHRGRCSRNASGRGPERRRSRLWPAGG